MQIHVSLRAAARIVPKRSMAEVWQGPLKELKKAPAADACAATRCDWMNCFIFEKAQITLRCGSHSADTGNYDIDLHY